MKPAEVSTPSDREVLVKRSFDAPVNLVWQAYTDPALMRRWLTAMPGWSMPVCEMATHVGSIAGAGETTRTARSLGSRERCLRSRCIRRSCIRKSTTRATWVDRWGGEPSIITVTFNETNGITNVATSIKFASKADRDAAMSTGMTDGMELSYQALDEVLAG